MSKKKTARWHIDYLTNKASVWSVVTFDSSQKLECALAEALGRQAAPISGFGCSDCDCTSHLFFAADQHDIMVAVDSAIEAACEPSTVLARQDIPGYLGLRRR
jgi:Uri superfamily endonuclease